eukprot:3813871-Pyramimonas_sp.AAC.1
MTPRAKYVCPSVSAKNGQVIGPCYLAFFQPLWKPFCDHPGLNRKVRRGRRDEDDVTWEPLGPFLGPARSWSCHPACCVGGDMAPFAVWEFGGLPWKVIKVGTHVQLLDETP